MCHKLNIVLLACSTLLATRPAPALELRLWHFWGAATLPVIEPLLAEFETAHPGIDITPEYQGNYDLLSRKLLAAIMAGDPPELFTLASADLPRFADTHHIVPLELSSRDQVDFFPAVVEAFTRHGHLWALPIEGATYALFWNPVLFREAGLPDRPPGTWEELIQFGKALTRDTDGDGKTDQWGFARHDKEYVGGSTILNLYFSNGVHFSDAAVPDFRSEEFLGPLQLWDDLCDKHHIAPRFLPQDAIPAGRVGMWIGGTFSIPALASRYDIRLARIPVLKDPVTLSSPDVLVAGRSDAAREAAARTFIAWITDTPQQIRLCRALGYLPTRESVLAHPPYTQFLIENPCYQPVADAMKRFRTKPARADWPAIQQALSGAREAVEHGRLEPAQALAEAQHRVEAELSSRNRTQGVSNPLAISGLAVLLGVGLAWRRLQRRGGLPGQKSAGRQEHAAWFFVLPQLLFFVLFTSMPLCGAAFLSFCEWNAPEAPRFTGLGNYGELSSDPELRAVLKRTLYWWLLTVPLNTAIACAVACLLHARPRFCRIGSFLLYPANLSSTVALALAWCWLLPPECLANPAAALPSLASLEWWRALGAFLIFLAALQAIPRQRFEAAALDGAGALTRFRHVSWPALRPVTFLVAATFSIDAFQTFDSIYVVSGGEGGPERSTTTLAFYLYETAFVHFHLGKACALALICAALLLGLILLQRRLLQGGEHQWQE